MATIDSQGNYVGTGSIVPSTPAPPITPAPATPPVTPTLGAQDIANKAAADKAANQGKPGFDVFGNPVAGAPNATGGATTTPPASTTGTTVGTTGVATPTSSGNANVDTNTNALIQAQNDLATKAQQFSDTITGISNGAIPLSVGDEAQIQGLKQQFDTLISSQNLINTGGVGGATVNSFATGAYSPLFHANTINQIASAGAQKIATLQTQEAAAVANLTTSLKNNNISAAKAAFDAYQTANEATQTSIQTAIAATQKALKDAADAKAAADKQQYDQVTKPTQDLAQIAKNNGASNDVMAKILNASSVDEAYQAAGNYAAQGTGMVAEYNYAKANGYTGTFSQYQTEDANRKATASAGALDAGTQSEVPAGMGGTSNGGSILSATGLSIAAFNYITQGTASMSRMTGGQRAQIMNEAQKWLNKNGVDISTFQSQYKAYNDVLQKNINRANQTAVMAGEVSGSADALIAVLDQKDLKGDPFNPLSGGLGNLRPQIIADIALGKQVNNPLAIKYATQFGFMANDLAGYLAAARGANTPENADIEDAATIISNGLSKRSVQAFKDSINSNEAKVAGVVNKAVDSTRKQVWSLFGVGDKYVGGNSTADVAAQDSKATLDKITTFRAANPTNDKMIQEMAQAGLTPEQISQQLGL